MKKSSRAEILANSSGWVAAVLNITPGLGTGYIYQRRWKAYWLTTVISFLWILIDFYNDLGISTLDPAESQNEFEGFLGLFAIAIISAIEAALSNKAAKETYGENIKISIDNKN